MPRIRLEHKTLLNGRFHVFTSPDIKGLHISAESQEAAKEEAVAVISLIMDQDGVSEPVEVVWPA